MPLLDTVEFWSKSNCDVAVVIRQVSATQRHVGIAYKDSKENNKVLHLCFHRDLRHDDLCSEWLCALFNGMHPIRLKILAGKCHQCWLANGKEKIPYGFDLPSRNTIDEKTGKYFQEEDSLGLSCSTFVLNLLYSTGLKLLDWETWPNRQEDEEWQKSFVNKFRKYLGDEHADALLACNISRIRPEEVAGGAVSPERCPVFSQIVPLAEKIIAELVAS